MSAAAGGGVPILSGKIVSSVGTDLIQPANRSVLAVMDIAADSLNGRNKVRGDNLRAARAAVAELIAAAKDYEAHPYDAEGVNLAARDRLRAALSNIEGGQ